MLSWRVLQQEDGVAAWVPSISECSQARAGRDGELDGQPGLSLQERPVVARVAEQQDDARGAEVTLLEADPSDEGLNVVDVRLGFDHDEWPRPAQPIDDAVGAT